MRSPKSVGIFSIGNQLDAQLRPWGVGAPRRGVLGEIDRPIHQIARGVQFRWNPSVAR
jgi:hypothetical protein